MCICVSLQVYDDCALSQDVRDDMYKCYPEGRRAHMKSGGNFPYLCASDEVNLHLEVGGSVFVIGHLSISISIEYELKKETESQS